MIERGRPNKHHATSRTLRSRKSLKPAGVGTSLLTARFEFVLVVCNGRFC
jgi:hypothetical protein